MSITTGGQVHQENSRVFGEDLADFLKAEKD
jgi:hypothetical protein